MASDSNSFDDFEMMDIAEQLSRMDNVNSMQGYIMEDDRALNLASILSADDHARSHWTAQDETETTEGIYKLESFLINSYSSENMLSLPNFPSGDDEGAAAAATPTGLGSARNKSRYKSRGGGSGEKLSSRRQVKKVIDTVLNIYSRLRSKQRKIERVIERSSAMHEEEARLSSLLNLSDKLSSVLDSAKRVVPEADTSDQQRNRSDSTDSTSAAFDMNQLMSIMYRLRMGGKGQRAEIANAASALGQLCRAEKVQQVQIIEAIKQVGGLQLLLSALTSYHDWEDVEMQISKVIAVLVMNEDDWQMLQRLAFEILSALYTLTLKVSARIRSPPSSSEPFPSARSPRQWQSDAEWPPAGPSDEQGGAQEVFDAEELSDCRGLVAGAVAQVTLVLCGEWRHSDNLFMWGASSPSAAAAAASSSSSSSAAGIGARRRSLSNGGAVPKSDFDKLLEAILNIILTINESSIPGGGADGPFSASGSILSLSQTLPRASRAAQLFTASGNINFSNFSMQQPQPLLDGSADDVEGSADDIATSPTIDDAAVLCSIALANLADIPQCRTTIVASRGLTLLHCWVEIAQGRFQELKYARDEYDSAAMVDSMELVSELLDNTTAAIMSICGGAVPSGEMFDPFPVFANDYTVGYIDAQVINDNLPALLVQFIASNIDRDAQDRLTSTLPPDACTHLLVALSHFSSRQKNRSHGMQTGVPFAMCKLFAFLATSFDPQLGRSASSTELLDADLKRTFSSNKSSRGSTGNFDHSTRRSFRSSSQLQVEQDEGVSPRLLQQITTCLDGLSFFNEFLEDTCYALDGDAFFDCLGRRTLIDLLSSPTIVSSLCKVVASLPRCPARLACLRVVNCLTHFPLSLRVLGESTSMVRHNLTQTYPTGFGIMESLVLICSEADDRHRVSYQSVAASEPIATAAGGPLTLAAFFARQDSSSERNGRDGTRADEESDEWHHNYGDESLSDCPEGGSAVEKEETLVVCSALANMCCYDKDLSRRLYTKGLLPIMLPLAQSRHLEISRQTVRCISAMGSVISSSPASNAMPPRRAHEETLAALTLALNSTSALVQREAVVGIANLSATEEFVRDAVVAGPLRGIVSILSDYKTERAMRDEAERVLRNLGFREGARDVELVSYDTQLLSDWFNLKMSLEPQMLSLRVIERWIAEDLFRDPAPYNATERDSAYNTPSSAASMSMLETRDSSSSHTAASSYEEETASLDKFYNRLSLSDPSLMSRTGRSQAGRHISPRGTPLNVTFKELQRNFFDSLQRLQNFCYAKPAGLLTLREGEELSDFGLPVGSAALGRATPPVTEGNIHSSRHSTPVASPLSVSSRHAAEVGEGVDRPPSSVVHLMDLLLPSRLHQNFFVGLMTLLPEGCLAALLEEEEEEPPALVEGGSSPCVALPEPYDVSTLYLPRRAYTFKLLGRVIHRLIADTERQGPNPNRWNLAFQDTDTVGDEEFHDQLLQALRLCPQIVCLSFTNREDVRAKDVRMGYLGGHVPNSVRFLHFKNFLCSTSVQSLCIYLRQQNAAYVPSEEPQGVRQFPSIPPKGLLGLGITHTPLKEDDIMSVIDLLRAGAAQRRTKETGSSSSSCDADSTEAISGGMGILLLDLSYDSMSDAACARVLAASSEASLRGLSLCGNSIRSLALAELRLLTAAGSNRLRHLGLSHCGLACDAFSQLLAMLTANTTLTSLDASHNDCNSCDKNKTDALNNAMKSLLLQNKGLRILDLSYNNLGAEAAERIYTSLLQNSTLLLLPLGGNRSVLQHRSFRLIQEHLRDNRSRYTRKVRTINDRYSAKAALSAGYDSGLEDGADHLSIDPPVAVSVDASALEEAGGPSVLGWTEPEHGSAELHVFFSAPLAWRDRQQSLHPLQMLDYRSERSELLRVFREVERDVSVSFSFATTDTLRTALTNGCRVMHLSGHGQPHCLNFEDGRCGLQQVDGSTLRSLLQAGTVHTTAPLDFVFVSACHSRATGDVFVAAGVRHVVCVKVDQMIQDSSATSFTRAFYIALLQAKTVRQSFDIAREALKASPYVCNSVLEGEKFVLLPEADDHNTVIFPFVARRRARLPQCRVRGLADTRHMPPPPLDFEGSRESDMYRIIYHLSTRRLVTLVGRAGIGKTALAEAVCNHIADRGMFDHGVLYVEAKGACDFSQLMTRLLAALRGGPRAVAEAARLTQATIGAPRDALATENLIIESLRGKCVLLTLDHLDDMLLGGSREEREPRNMTLSSFFSFLLHNSSIKVLITSSTTLSEANVRLFNTIVEVPLALGPLTLLSSLRLFARLAKAQSLASATAKANFVSSLIPPKQQDVTIGSRYITETSAAILAKFGSGHPADIVKMACDCSARDFEKLLEDCKQILLDGGAEAY